MPDNKHKGIYDKFYVSRTDRKDVYPDSKHYQCDYFVLDLTHDELALPAIMAYATEARKKGYHKLANDLFIKAKKMEAVILRRIQDDE